MKYFLCALLIGFASVGLATMVMDIGEMVANYHRDQTLLHSKLEVTSNELALCQANNQDELWWEANNNFEAKVTTTFKNIYSEGSFDPSMFSTSSPLWNYYRSTFWVINGEGSSAVAKEAGTTTWAVMPNLGVFFQCYGLKCAVYE